MAAVNKSPILAKKDLLFICKEYTLLQKLTIKFFFANDKTYGIFK